jgi:hypothetical protein
MGSRISIFTAEKEKLMVHTTEGMSRNEEASDEGLAHKCKDI